MTSQITNFQEQSPGWTTVIGTGSDPTMNLSNNSDSDLGNFLERPTRIAEYQWAVSSPLFERLNPWQLFLNDPRVAEKIANFELYRSKLMSRWLYLALVFIMVGLLYLTILTLALMKLLLRGTSSMST